MLILFLSCGAASTASTTAVSPSSTEEAPQPAWTPKNQCAKAEEEVLTCLGPADESPPSGDLVTSLCWDGSKLELRSGPGGQPDVVLSGGWSYSERTIEHAGIQLHELKRERVVISDSSQGNIFSVKVDDKELCGTPGVSTWELPSVKDKVSGSDAVGHCSAGEPVRFHCVVEDGRSVSICGDELRVGMPGSPVVTAGPPSHEEVTFARGMGEQVTFVDDGLELLVVETIGTGDGNFFGLVAGDSALACTGADGEVHDRLGELK